MDANAPTHVDANAHLATSQVASGVSATVAHARAHADHLDLVDLYVPLDRGNLIDHTTLGIMIDRYHLMKLIINRRDALHLDTLCLINRESTSLRGIAIPQARTAKL